MSETTSRTREQKLKHEWYIRYKNGKSRANGKPTGCATGYSWVETQRYRSEARDKARKFVEDNIDSDAVFGEGAVVPGTDEHKAKEALIALVAVTKDECTPIRDKITALKTILDFTKERPATKQKVTLDKSEEWLLAVEADLAKHQAKK